MAISIKNEGIINPIEIDKSYMIITGEMRWRAAQAIGLEKVPCKIILEISNDERFIRQMHENLHNNTMSAWDTAKGLEKTAKIIKAISAVKFVCNKFHQSEYFQRAAKELHELYGVSQSTVSEYLSILAEPEYVQKALREFKIKRTKIIEANNAPKIFRNKLKRKVVAEPSLPRDVIRYISSTLSRAKNNGELDKGEKILKENYDGLTIYDAKKRIDEIYPTGMEVLEKSGDRMNKMLELTNELGAYLKDNPLASFVSFDAQNLRVQLSAFIVVIKEYLERESSLDVKKITAGDKDK